MQARRHNPMTDFLNNWVKQGNPIVQVTFKESQITQALQDQINADTQAILKCKNHREIVDTLTNQIRSALASMVENLAWLKRENKNASLQDYQSTLYNLAQSYLESLQAKISKNLHENNRDLPGAYDAFHYMEVDLLAQLTEEQYLKDIYNARVTKSVDLQVVARPREVHDDILDLMIALREENQRKGLFANKEVKQTQVNFLEKITQSLDANDSIETIIVAASNNKPQTLYDVLKSKRVSQLVTSLLKGSNQGERTENYLLKQMIDIRSKQPQINPQPDTHKVDSLLTSASNLAKQEVNELGLFASNKLKLAKVDFLCDFITILNVHKTLNISDAKELIKRDLSSLVLDHLGEANFKHALEGKRVKEIVLAATGAKSVNALLSELKTLHAQKRDQAAGPIAFAANCMRNVHHLITQYKIDDAIGLMDAARDTFANLASISYNPSYTIDQRAECAKLCETYSHYNLLFAQYQNASQPDPKHNAMIDSSYQHIIKYQELSENLLGGMRDGRALSRVDKLYKECDENVREVTNTLAAEVSRTSAPGPSRR